MTTTIKDADIFEYIGPLFRKLTEAVITHQTSENGAPYILVCSDRYKARYRIQLESFLTENLLMKYMIGESIREFGREEGLRRLFYVLLGCFTEGEINDFGVEVVKGAHLEYLHDDLAKQAVH